ncbi:glycine/sarcosine/dimethylglycine N-methyltransferase [bacterium BMS3Abin15]|nr:glycine/sarcosine/dimethylglycine N-methyltransferase [bacterium BMS3Abin15]
MEVKKTMENKTKNKDAVLWDYHQTENVAHLIPAYIRQDMLYRKVAKRIDGGKVIEIGFGDGYLLSKLSNKYECYGADISDKNIEKTKKILKEKASLSLVGTDGRLPFEDNYFDAFIASEVLEHMSDEELQKTIYEVQRVLMPGGYAFVTVPAEENLKNNECFCPNCKSRFHKWGHKQRWDKEIIKKTFNNFKIIDISEYYNRFVGTNKLENIMGRIMQTIQTTINYFLKFPNKIYRNRNFVIVLKNRK